GLVNDAAVGGEVEEVAGGGDALVVHNVELGVLEGRGDLVLDDAGAGAAAHGLLALLDRAGAADGDADGGGELEGAAAGRGLGGAVHHADLLADLVDEDDGAVAPGDDAGELAHGLGHEAGLEADDGLAHLALDLGLGDEGGDGVDDDEINRVGTDK